MPHNSNRLNKRFRKLLKELDRSQEDLYLLSNGLQAGIWRWEAKGPRTSFSPLFYKLLGYEANEIHLCFEFIEKNIVHPLDLERLKVSAHHHLKNNEPFIIELRLRLKNKQYRWFQAFGQVKRNLNFEPKVMVGAIVDIHERKELQNRLDQQSFLLQEAQRIGKIGVWEFDLSTEEFYWSNNVYDLLQLNPNDKLSLRRIFHLCSFESIQNFKTVLRKTLNQGERYDLELEVKRTKQQHLWIRAIGEAIKSEDGKIHKLRGIFQDISQEKQSDIELFKTLDLLNQQNHKLELISHKMSHDLRNHASNLVQLFELHDDSNDVQEKEFYIRNIRKVSRLAFDSIVNLQNRIKLISEADSESTFQDIDLSELVHEIRNILEGDIIENQAKISLNLEATQKIQFVPEYLSSILLNLVSNSLRYRHPDRRPNIHISTHVNEAFPNMLELRCEDNGQGIDLAQHGEQLFGLYQTFHAHPDSTGLGLYLVKKQLEEYGGFIDVSSTPEKGTTFHVFLPQLELET